jgi:hypothetical protein
MTPSTGSDQLGLLSDNIQYSLHTLATTIQEERQMLEGQARSVWNITVSGLTEQLSQVEQLNEKTWKVGRPGLI